MPSLAVLAAIAAAAGLWSARGGGEVAAPPAARIALGEELYAENCAACHGANLEGQPNWRVADPSGRLPAPPHDATGHTWHHPDDVLFRIVHDGSAAVIGDGYESDMPGFGDIMSDDEIRAVLDFIKSTWPQRAQTYQAEISRSQ
ncbi:c-type cytochrome [Jannaschia seosinensis]|uniref:c-type cytochrome n=1 Tax=Jannaschia seosinensis TaxID=313367 RepID=UPI003521C540